MEKRLAGYIIGDTLTEDQAMEWAIELAQKGVGFVSPNPPVGCVILSSQRELIGFGYHEKYGSEHAEIKALSSVKNPLQLKGALVFVTLEPCAHQGKTPPCSERLKKLPIAQLVYAMEDPHSKVSGKGLADIKKGGGIQVKKYHFSDKQKECEILLKKMMNPFLYSIQNKKSYVSLKVACTFDGVMALKNGQSQWITNELSREYVHQLRAENDALLIGIETFKSDQPKLNVRHKYYPQKQNKVILLDPKGESLSTMIKSSVYECHNPEDIYVVVCKGVDVQNAFGVKVLVAPELSPGNFDLSWLTNEFYRLEIGTIMLEGGAGVYSSFLKQKQVQKCYLFYGSKILGMSSGVSWTKALEIESLEKSLEFNEVSVKTFGNNILVEGTLL